MNVVSAGEGTFVSTLFTFYTVYYFNIRNRIKCIVVRTNLLSHGLHIPVGSGSAYLELHLD